jgi:hypothetical protein
MRRTFPALLVLLAAVLSTAPACAQTYGSYGGYRAAGQYDRGYRDGFRDGERDARRGDRFYYDNDRQPSNRDDRFQRGYTDGYRAAYEQFRGFNRGRDSRSNTRRVRPGYQDPAYARGYADGYDKGVDDGRDRDRYDPVRHRDYRSADDGYSKEYGSKQAYENNYRSGFRQGYEAGYRDGTRRR